MPTRAKLRDVWKAKRKKLRTSVICPSIVEVSRTVDSRQGVMVDICDSGASPASYGGELDCEFIHRF